MIPEPNKQNLKMWTPAIYHIEVVGEVEESWCDLLAGMCITTRKGLDQRAVTELIGRVMDQAELLGVLNSLYELRLPIVSVKILDEKSLKEE